MKRMNYTSKRKIGICALMIFFIMAPAMSFADSNASQVVAANGGFGTGSAGSSNDAAADGATIGGSGASAGLSTAAIAGIIAGSVVVIGAAAAATSGDGSEASIMHTTAHH